MCYFYYDDKVSSRHFELVRQFYSVHEVHLGEHLFTTQRFFTFLLPPIMLEAGYFMPKKAFFNNIGTILTYAVIGTLFNAFAIGLTLYGAYRVGAFPGIDDGIEDGKSLGVLDKARK